MSLKGGVGVDIEALLREHVWTLAIAAAAVGGCFLVLSRAFDRARALVETSSALARARAVLEERRARGFDVPLLPRLESLDDRVRRLRE